MIGQILVFGDSIAEGFWDVKCGWVERLKSFLNKKMLADKEFWCLVRNLSVSANTSRDLLKRFVSETSARSYDEGKQAIIFEIGLNDSAYFKQKEHPYISENEFEENVNELISQARKFTKEIIFLAAQPVDERKVYTKAWIGHHGKFFYNNERITKYNAIIKKICIEQKIYFLDLPKEFVRPGYEKLLFDGLHPNTKGHALIFKAVKKFLYQNRLIE